MTKLIYELADQVIHEIGPGEWNIPDEFLERFSKLIVKECIDVCLAMRNPSTLNYKPSERAAEELRFHFGVK